jgi:hypothetical protein
MMRRSIVVFALFGALALAPMSAGAAPGSTFVLHYKGRAGSAILTDCPVGAPVGTTCRAVNVFAFEQRVNSQGDKGGSGPGVQVELYNVTITAADPFFDAVLIGAGFTQAGTVKINGSLSKGEVSAANVPLCDDFIICAPGDPTSLSVSVQWSGFGPTSTFKTHDKFKDPFCFLNARNGGSFRFATATGTVNGATFVETNIAGFESSLQSNSFGTVEHCG